MRSSLTRVLRLSISQLHRCSQWNHPGHCRVVRWAHHVPCSSQWTPPSTGWCLRRSLQIYHSCKRRKSNYSYCLFQKAKIFVLLLLDLTKYQMLLMKVGQDYTFYNHKHYNYPYKHKYLLEYSPKDQLLSKNSLA